MQYVLIFHKQDISLLDFLTLNVINMQSVMSQIFKSIVQTHCERKLYIHFLII